MPGKTQAKPPSSASGKEVIRFTEIADVNPPVDASALTDDAEVAFIPMSDVTETAQWVNRQVRRFGDVASGYTAFQEGDVLFAKITPCTENGKGCHAIGLTGGVGFGSTEFHILRAKEGINPRIVFHLSTAREIRSQAAAMMGGSAGQQRVPTDFFRHVRLSSSWMARQDRFAALLDSVDEAIESTRVVIEQTRRLKTALLQDLLTNGLPGRHKRFKQVYRIGRIPSGWTDANLEDVAEVVQGIALGPHREPQNNPTPYLRVANVQQGHITLDEVKEIETSDAERQRYALTAGDVLMVEGHANIDELGRAALVTADCESMVYQNHLFRVRCDRRKLDPRFLTAWINSPPGREYFKIFGGTTSGLNTVGSSQIKALCVPLPEIDEQVAICNLLEAVDTQAKASASLAEQLTATKSGLSQGLLSGRIPVEGGA